MGILCPSVAYMYRVCREFFVIKLLWRAVGSIPTPAIGVGRDERAAGDEVVRGTSHGIETDRFDQDRLGTNAGQPPQQKNTHRVVAN